MNKFKQRKQYWYAVFAGACPGVYSNYADAQLQVVNFPKSDMRRFDSEEEANTSFNKCSRSDYDINKTINWEPSRPLRR